MEYKSGKTYYLASTCSKQTVTVVKAGRKYATLLEVRGKVDVTTDRLYDNAYFIGKIYPSKDAYEETMLKEELLLQLRTKLANITPDSVTLEQVKQAYTILGVVIDERDLVEKFYTQS